MSRKSKGDVAAVDVGPDGVTPMTPEERDQWQEETGGRIPPAEANGSGKRLTPAQERRRAERLARRPRYWIMRMTGNGLPDSVVAILGSRSAADRKVREYASVLRLSPESLCVFRVSTPEDYRYPE